MGNNMLSKLTFFLAFSFCLAAAAPLARAEADKLHRSGYVVIDQGQGGYIVTASFGGGTLHTADHSYKFKLGGIGIGGIGVSSLKATGTVYNLGTVQNFPGTYISVRTGFAIGEKGRGKLWLKNDKGVYMELQVKRKGLMLSTGVDGVIVTMK